MKRTKGWKTRQAQVALGTIPMNATVEFEDGDAYHRVKGIHPRRGEGVYWMRRRLTLGAGRVAIMQKTIDYEYVLRGTF